MKYLISISVLVILILSGCTNVSKSVPENSPTATGFAENLQESTSAETSIGEGASTTSIEIVGGNEESLREFIKQWLVPIYSNDSSQDMTV